MSMKYLCALCIAGVCGVILIKSGNSVTRGVGYGVLATTVVGFCISFVLQMYLLVLKLRKR